MESSKNRISARGKAVLSLALEKLAANPPEVSQLSIEEMSDSAVYHKTVSDTVVEEMRKRGYLVAPPPRWIANFNSRTDFLKRLNHARVEQSEFERSLQQAKQCIDELKIEADKSPRKSEEEWEDVDTSFASNKSLSSKAAARNSSMQNAKKGMKQMMLDGAKRNSNQTVKVDPNRSARVRKDTSSNDPQLSKGEHRARPLKRQASTVLAPDAKKEKKNTSLGVDKTEFARSQNSRVQLVKERKQSQDRERSEQLKAKLRQKQTMPKENERKAPGAAQKASSSGAKKVKTATCSGGVLKPEPYIENSNTRSVNSTKTKAEQGRSKDPLKTQACGDGVMAPAGETVVAINSTFLPGIDSKPDFDASLALRNGIIASVAETASNATYISKPGLASPPPKQTKIEENAMSFIDSFNETYKDYGLQDLCSDSDNTDDEAAPTKPIPKWADMKSSRFKDRVQKQRQLGIFITKYGLMDICMPPSVDLEMIFDETSKRFHHHDVSSGIWNETQDFIRS